MFVYFLLLFCAKNMLGWSRDEPYEWALPQRNIDYPKYLPILNQFINRGPKTKIWQLSRDEKAHNV